MPRDHAAVDDPILIVPAAPSAKPLAAACADLLREAGHAVVEADDLRRVMTEPGGPPRGLALCAVAERGSRDHRLLDLLRHMPDRPPVLVAGVHSAQTSHDLVMAGAFATVEGPGDPKGLALAAARGVRLARALTAESLRCPMPEDPKRILGVSEPSLEALRLIRRAAESMAPVLVVGESGAGRHLAARAIHDASRGRRKEGPFVRCCLVAIEPSEMKEALYGAESRPGPFERAHGGTLLLDDISRLPISLQESLLEMIAAGHAATVRRADDSATMAADVRLVVGSPGELQLEPGRGRLREDLSYRLTVLPIRLPSLRERIADIPILADTLLDHHAGLAGKTIAGFTPAAVRWMQSRTWPGNLPELEECIARGVARARGPTLDLIDVTETAEDLAQAPCPGTIEVTVALDEALTLADLAERTATVAEVLAIRRALALTGGNVTHAARLLRISRIHMQKRMKLYGLRDGR